MTVGKGSPLDRYRHTQIITASQTTLIVMLYDEAMKHVRKAQRLIDDQPQSFEPVSRHIVRAQDIVTELMAALDFDQGGQIAQSLFSLYLYVNRQLLEANVKKDPQLLHAVYSVLEDLRGAWAQLAGRADVTPRPTSMGGLNIAG